MVELRLEHARVRVGVNHASLMLKCFILIVLSLFWLPSNILVFIIMFLAISKELE